MVRRIDTRNRVPRGDRYLLSALRDQYRTAVTFRRDNAGQLPMRSGPPALVPLWRVMLISIGLFWFLAIVVFVATQWITPAITPSSTSPVSGFNYGQAFAPLVKTWGLWVAAALVVLGLFAAVWRALERGGETIVGKAAGAHSRRRRG